MPNAEVPIGYVFVREGRVIAAARNRTNELLNATRHADCRARSHGLLQRFPSERQDSGLHPTKAPSEAPSSADRSNIFQETTLMYGAAP
ncbi:hypothetical protein CF319_g1136 [Tilletia indica]|nr:hypothetical protein CF319_g1136 [Tilletia indica]KAE8228786.1 hypothetical protein CF326_g6269 [Tilletia indica]